MSALNEARRLKGALPALSVTTMIYFTVGKNLEKTHKKCFFKDNCLMLSKWKYYINITRKTHYRTRFFIYFLARIWMGPTKEDLKLSFFPLFRIFFQQCNITNLPGLQPCFETLGIFFRSHAERNVEIKATSSQIRYIVCQLNQPSTWHMSSF